MGVYHLVYFFLVFDESDRGSGRAFENKKRWSKSKGEKKKPLSKSCVWSLIKCHLESKKHLDIYPWKAPPRPGS